MVLKQLIKRDSSISLDSPGSLTPTVSIRSLLKKDPSASTLVKDETIGSGTNEGRFSAWKSLRNRLSIRNLAEVSIVSFSREEPEVRFIENRYDLSDDEYYSYWIQPDENDRCIDQCWDIIDACEKKEINQESDQYCTRGLESYIIERREGKEFHRKKRRDAYTAVLLWGRGLSDEEISRRYQTVSGHCRSLALEYARRDAIVAKQIYAEENSSPPPKLRSRSGRVNGGGAARGRDTQPKRSGSGNDNVGINSSSHQRNGTKNGPKAAGLRSGDDSDHIMSVNTSTRQQKSSKAAPKKRRSSGQINTSSANAKKLSSLRDVATKGQAEEPCANTRRERPARRREVFRSRSPRRTRRSSSVERPSRRRGIVRSKSPARPATRRSSSLKPKRPSTPKSQNMGDLKESPSTPNRREKRTKSCPSIKVEATVKPLPSPKQITIDLQPSNQAPAGTSSTTKKKPSRHSYHERRTQHRPQRMMHKSSSNLTYSSSSSESESSDDEMGQSNKLTRDRATWLWHKAALRLEGLQATKKDKETQVPTAILATFGNLRREDDAMSEVTMQIKNRSPPTTSGDSSSGSKRSHETNAGVPPTLLKPTHSA